MQRITKILDPAWALLTVGPLASATIELMRPAEIAVAAPDVNGRLRPCNMR